MSMFDQKMSILHILTTAVLASGPVFVFVGVLVKQSTENVTQTKSKTAPSVNVFSGGFLLIFASQMNGHYFYRILLIFVAETELSK